MTLAGVQPGTLLVHLRDRRHFEHEMETIHGWTRGVDWEMVGQDAGTSRRVLGRCMASERL